MKADVDWTSYAQVYDLMAENNPAYQEIVGLAKEEVGRWGLGTGTVVADIGAGTGNFGLEIAAMRPEVRVIHVDNDEGMIGEARRKRDAAGLRNVEFMKRDASDLRFDEGSLDGVICVHALYTLPNPGSVLREMHRALKPGAPMFLCNLGREMKVNDWAGYLFKSLRRELGLWGALRVFYRGRDVARQNRRIREKQRAGEYWMHSPEEFRIALEGAGFVVRWQRMCYRGCSDLIVCVRGGARAGQLHVTKAHAPG